MESSSKKTRVSSYPEVAIGDITDLKTLIEASQKESLWRLLEEKKTECTLLAGRLTRLEDDTGRLRRRAASYSCLFNKLVSLSGRQPSEDLIDVDDPDGLASRLWGLLMEHRNVPSTDAIGKDLDLEARLRVVGEELETYKELVHQRDAEILSLQKQKNRLELFASRTSNTSLREDATRSPCPALAETPNEQASPTSAGAIELAMAQSLAAKRLEELQAMDTERAELIHKSSLLRESLKRIPEELIREPRKAYDLVQEISSLKSENSRLRRAALDSEEKFNSAMKKKDARIVEMEVLLANKRVDANKVLDSIQAEASRMRKERDNMRELYEHANSQVLAAGKTMSHSQAMIEKLQSKCNVYNVQTERLGRILAKLNEISASDHHAGIQATIQSLKDNEASLYQELETIGKSFDELAGQNQSLSRQLAERDETLGKLTSEKLRAEFSSMQVRKDAEIAMQKAQAIEVSSLERIANAESLEVRFRRDLAEIEHKLLARQAEDEKAQQMVQELRIESQRLKSQLDHVGSLKLEEELAENMRQLERVRLEKRRMEDELDVARLQLKRYSESKGALSDDLEKELTMYKKLMKCNSCHTRDKNAIITKCMHVFCRPCLDSRLETRQRKCPNCGEPFGANDVRNIYL